MATNYFQMQKKLTLKQAMWKDILVEFNYVLEYKQDKGNVVDDALNRKAKLSVVTSISCDF